MYIRTASIFLCVFLLQYSVHCSACAYMYTATEWLYCCSQSFTIVIVEACVVAHQCYTLGDSQHRSVRVHSQKRGLHLGLHSSASATSIAIVLCEY